MWPFPSHDKTPTDRERDRARDDQIAQLESELRRIRVEWEEWYDKYRRLYARISKRAERDTENGPESHQDARHATNDGTVGGNGAKRAHRNLRGF